LAALVALAATACGGSGGQCLRSEAIALRLRPAAQLNLDREGFTRSVVVRVYQVDKDAASSFSALWSDRAEQRASAEWIAVPGRPVSRTLARDPKATRLVVAANFREHTSDSAWRAVVALPAPKDPCAHDDNPPVARLEVDLADYRLRLRARQVAR
jgi:type VI secretion system VasD/TssJ family lipoprotein